MSDFMTPQTFTFSGSTDTEAFGADAAGNVAATSFGANVVGFVDENGTFVRIAPAATNSDANGMSDAGLVVGDADGQAITYQVGGSGAAAINLSSLSATITSSSAFAVSESGKNIVGDYSDSGNDFVQFVDLNGTLAKVVVPGSDTGSTTANAVNDSGEVVGSFSVPAGTSAFIYQDGFYTEFEVPNAFTIATAVNDSGLVVGNAIGASSESAFERDATGKVTLINAPNATSTSASGVNDSGQVVGTYTDSNGNQHGYVYDNGSFITVDVPGAQGIFISSINSQGEISGNYFDGTKTVAFADKPVPEVKLTSAGATGADKSQFTITGTALSAGQAPEVGQTVTIFDNNQSIGTTTVAKDGTFSDALTLPNVGVNAITASVTADGVTGTSAAVNYNLFQAVRDLDATGQEVEQLYYSLLNRAADPASLAADEAALAKHPRQVDNIANSLIKSAEYAGLHGHQSNSQFVQALYEGALGRAPDAASLTSDVHHLAHGLSRQALAVSVAESPEALGHLATRSV